MPEDLQRSLDRVSRALGEPGAALPPARSWLQPAAPVAAAALTAAAFLSGSMLLLVPAAALVGWRLWVWRGSALARDLRFPHIGMGADVAEDAVIEPGAVIEMGASIGRGALVRGGAIVRSGASVGKGAVIEANAVISWGADVHAEARVGTGAVVGAGADVHKRAQVPAGMRLAPGADYRGRVAAAAQPADPREQRLDAACAQLEAGLRDASPVVRERLGATAQTVVALRAAYRGLLQRERMLRAEVSGSAALETERASLAARLQAATDDEIRRSLAGALQAIDGQKRQHEALRRAADRIEAELTRLVLTIEGMAKQLARLRDAGAELQAGDTHALEGARQLHEEIEALADALEDVARADRMPRELASAPPDSVPAAGRPARERE
jgi:carbonic anhydrase/acetyltransferase-like protein (isoleucine patch superfamily)